MLIFFLKKILITLTLHQVQQYDDDDDDDDDDDVLKISLYHKF